MEFLSLKRLAAYCLIVTTALLVGCYATTEIEMNKENKSVDGYGSVKEIYVVRAKNDARRAIPKVMTQLEARGFKVAYLDESTPGNSQGTGFVISGDGYILTCAHVLDHATEATIKNGEERYLAEPVISDEDKDIAILKVKDKFVSKGVLGFRKQSQASIGDEISTLSYPLTSILGNDVRYSKGNINATSGLKDDVNHISLSLI